jgi:3-oxoacyl-[acyl-carrier-protein] synthase II
MKRRVVVTGLGVVTSLGCKVDELWGRICAGESGVHPLRLIDASNYKVRFAADVYDWDPSDYISPKEAKRLDRFTQFAIVAADDAVRQSGLDFSREESFRCGVILGSGIGGLTEMEQQVERLLTKGPDRVSALTIPKLMLNAAGGNISIRHGIRGPNYTVATACASATNAMGDALKTIQYGDADVMVTGGTEAAITRMGLSAFANMKALSVRNDDPAGASRPFDLDRDGFVLSEGAGILVFEDFEHARNRNADILAEVLGFGASGDAGHITSPDVEGKGAAKAMLRALEDAGINPEDMDYINAHGTATQQGDKAETYAIKQVFGEHAYKLSISSTKSQLGHSLGASGGIEAIMSIKAIQESTVPPTSNLEKPDPDCDLDYTPLQPRERRIRTFMSNSFGFGGHNAVVLMGALQNGRDHTARG